MVVTLDAFTSGGGGGGGTSAPDATVRARGSALAIATNAETTVATRLVPGGFTFHLTQVIGTGSADGEWVVYDDAVEVYRTRTSGADRGLELLHGNAIPFAAGHTCTVKVVHENPNVQNFYATLFGYDT